MMSGPVLAFVLPDATMPPLLQMQSLFTDFHQNSFGRMQVDRFFSRIDFSLV